MTAEKIKQRLDAAPFRPFELCLADGRTRQVDHPDLLAFAGKFRVVILCTEDSQVEVIDVMLIVSIRFSDATFVHEPLPVKAITEDQF